MKKILYCIMSFMIIIANTQHAYAASSWSITGAVSAGARTIVSATKSGYKSAVNVMPTAARLGSGLLRMGNTAALLYAAAQLANDGIDFVLDPANNRITYKVVGEGNHPGCPPSLPSDSAYKFDSKSSSGDGKTISHYCNYRTVSGFTASELVSVQNVVDYITIPAAAAQVLKNAQNGDISAQEAVRGVATEMVISGQFDQDLLSGAVPINDTKPLVPSVPISGNGNVTHGESWEGGDGMSGATPGEQADAAKAAADAARKAAQAAADAANAAAEDARRAADEAADLVNSGADQAAIDAADDRAKAAEQAAADAKAAADAAIAAADARAKAAEAAAARAAEQAAADAAAAEQAAADAIAAAEQAAEADKAAAQAAADAAVAAANKAKAEAQARAKAAEEAAKAAEKAKAEAQKPFELPPFCSWAAPVCDAIDWLKKDPAQVAPVPVDVSDNVPTRSPNEFDTEYVNFGGQCPSFGSHNISVGSVSVPLTIDITPLCGLAELVRPAVIGSAYLVATGLVVAAIREA